MAEMSGDAVPFAGSPKSGGGAEKGGFASLPSFSGKGKETALTGETGLMASSGFNGVSLAMASGTVGGMAWSGTDGWERGCMETAESAGGAIPGTVGRGVVCGWAAGPVAGSPWGLGCGTACGTTGVRRSVSGEVSKGAAAWRTGGMVDGASTAACGMAWEMVCGWGGGGMGASSGAAAGAMDDAGREMSAGGSGAFPVVRGNSGDGVGGGTVRDSGIAWAMAWGDGDGRGAAGTECSGLGVV